MYDTLLWRCSGFLARGAQHFQLCFVICTMVPPCEPRLACLTMHLYRKSWRVYTEEGWCQQLHRFEVSGPGPTSTILRCDFGNLCVDVGIITFWNAITQSSLLYSSGGTSSVFSASLVPNVCTWNSHWGLYVPAVFASPFFVPAFYSYQVATCHEAEQRTFYDIRWMNYNIVSI